MSKGAGCERVRVLVSACLLGERVRYDGGHKRNAFLVETLGKFVELVPVCPEVECGLPVPREAMRLAGDPGSPRLVTVRTGADHTELMASWTMGKLRSLHSLGLRGYVCKADSPSCGIVCGGLFTKAFRERFPLVPAEEEATLPGFTRGLTGENGEG